MCNSFLIYAVNHHCRWWSLWNLRFIFTYLFILILKLYWSVVDLQYCDNFCNTKSDSVIHIYTSILFQILSPYRLSSILGRVPCAPEQVSPWPSIPWTIVCKCQTQTHNPSLHTPVPFGSHRFIFQDCVSLFMFCKWLHLYLFVDSTYKWYHMMFVFLCLIASLSMKISKSIHVAANDIIYSFLWLKNTLLYICTTSSLSIPLSMDI